MISTGTSTLLLADMPDEDLLLQMVWFIPWILLRRDPKSFNVL